MEEKKTEAKKPYESVKFEFIPLEMNENIAMSGYYETDAEGNEYFVNPKVEDQFKR